MSAFATEKVRSPDGSFTISELNRRDADARDAAPMVTRCSHCDWTFDGPAGLGRSEAAEHFMSAHPHLKSQNKKGAKSPAREEAMVAVEQRAAIATASAKREENPMQEAAPPQAPAVRDFPCKADGCTNRTTLNKGRYAYTCPEHRNVGNPSPERRESSPKKTKGSASNGKVNGKPPRDRLQVLHDMVVTEQDLINARVHVAQLEESFDALAAEFSKAAA